MKVTGIKINNYRSLGVAQNYLLIEPTVTALIGKNESGKSNILEAIGELSFLKPMNASYINNKNRGAYTDSISVVVDLEFSKRELDELEIEDSKTTICFTEDKRVEFKGGLSDLIKKNTEFIDAVNNIIETEKDKEIWGNKNLKSISEIINILKTISSLIFIDYNNEVNKLKRMILKDYAHRKELIKKIDTVLKEINNYYQLLPKIFYRKQDRQLKFSYKYDDIKNIIEDDDDIFCRFIKVAGVSKEDIINAFEESVDGHKLTIQNKIKRKVKTNIEEKFNSFYTQEKIEFQIDFDSKFFKIYILTDDKVMNLSERSNGLRWYLSLFIEVLSEDYEGSVLYLLDEPGVHLHVNAQKELLKFFTDLAKKENQIIYTTHSPYMIDGHDILNVRAIEKDETGNTKIFKSAYHQDLSLDSKMETLSPLINAIGMDIKYNIGPSSKLNIITEGITDYMYLKAMMKYLLIDNQPYIIPSAGVTNINKIVSILIGWGCDFKIILDYDKAGYKEYMVLIKDLDDTLKKNIFFVNGSSEINLDEMKSLGKTTESLVSKKDYEKLKNPYDGTDSTKTLAAKEFCDKVKNEEIELEEETVLNFEKLLKQLNLIVNEVDMQEIETSSDVAATGET